MNTHDKTYNSFSSTTFMIDLDLKKSIKQAKRDIKALLEWSQDAERTRSPPLKKAMQRKKEYLTSLLEALEDLQTQIEEDRHLLDQHDLELMSKIFYLRDNGYKRALVTTTTDKIWRMNPQNPTGDSMTELRESELVWIFKHEENAGIYISLSDIKDIEGVNEVKI